MAKKSDGTEATNNFESFQATNNWETETILDIVQWYSKQRLLPVRKRDANNIL